LVRGTDDITALSQETGDPIEAGDKERLHESEIPTELITVIEDRQKDQEIKLASSEDESSDFPATVDVRKRDACILIRAIRKIAYELRDRGKEKRRNQRGKFTGRLSRWKIR
jgi:hypothetical protein